MMLSYRKNSSGSKKEVREKKKGVVGEQAAEMVAPQESKRWVWIYPAQIRGFE